MKQVTKRFLSIMLACVMLIGMLPVSAFAADTGSDETPTVPAESQEAVTEVTTTAPEESSSETAAVAPVASEPAEDESDVPEATVPAAAKSAAADPVQQLYDTLMAIHTYEELSDYMDNMTEEQYELLAQFSDDQNAALTAKITQLQEYEAEALPAGPNAPEPSNPTQPTTTAPEEDHTFTHLDVRIQDIKLTMTKRVINMVTGTVVSSNPITITANLTKVEYVTINGVTYNAFYKMSAREWRQSYVKINLSALTDSSTAVLVVDLVDKNGKTYNDVRITYNRAGIQYAIEHCDGYKANGGNIQYDGIDFDPAEGSNNITQIEYDDYVIPVLKIWDDAENQDGIRPSSVTVNLYANGELNDSAVLNANNNWQHMFTDKPSQDGSGNAISYTIDEASVPTGYTKVVGNNGTYLTVTNSHTPETIDISGSKTWDDNDDQDGKRPDSITVNLLADGEKVASKIVTEADGWAWSFTDLPKYADGSEIVYTVTEDAVADYTPEINGYNVTNTHEIEKTSVSGSKTWVDNDDQDGKRPETITINLLADGEVVDSVTVTEEDGWAWSFENLDKYANGSEIVYTITEDAVEGYSAEIDGYNVTNTHEIEKTSVSVTKEWNDADNQDGKRPASVTVQLKADGAAQGDPVELSESNSWSYTFEDLDKYADGEEVIYTVEETDVPTGYEAEVTGNQAEGYTVTNTHEIEKISVSGSKTWVDNNDQDGVRPESITINLLADGEQIDSATVTATEGWEWSFTDLPKYRDQGTEIVYSIAEVAVDDYSTTYDGYNVTNTHIPEEIEISVTKVWDDAENQDGIRPNDITVVLNADGEKIASTVLSEGNDWTDAFTDLPKYRDQGIEIVYIVEEIEVDGYVSVITGTQAEGYTITNTHTPETVAVEGTKTWDDNDNQDGARPESITINLLKNGEVLESKTVTEVDGWVWSFTDLPKYENQGSEITYSITEVAVDDYSTTYDGYDVINTHTPEKTSVTVTKSWQDSNDQDGIRPDAITVILLANGEATEQTLELNADNNWTGSFTELDKFAAGEAITYTVAEVAVEGYETVISGDQTAGYVITNSYTPETVAVEGSKTWDDNDDQDGKRPASITINLLKDGEILESKTVTEADGWAWSFTELPKYENHGTEIVYAITENAVADYSTTYDGYNVTNSYTPEEISITVNKAWADSNNAEGIRPDSVTIKLLANGEDTGLTLTLSVEDKWTGSFTGLAKYADGVAIEYTIDEVSVKGYNTVIKGSVEEGFVVTNSHTYIPQTGDERTPIMWITMMAVSGMMIVLAVFDSKKKKRATK